MNSERGIVIVGAGSSGTISKSALAHYGLDKTLTTPTTIQDSIVKDSSIPISKINVPDYFQKRPLNRRERRKNERKKK